MHAHLMNAVVLATTTSSTKKSSSGSVYSILFLVLIFAAAYFVFIRPARNRQAQAQQARRQGAVGDEIITTSSLG